MSFDSQADLYDPTTLISLLTEYLAGAMTWQPFSEAVMDLWQEIAHAESVEQERRPRLTPGALQRMGLSPDADPDSMTPRERSVRDILGGLDEDIRWHLGDEADTADEDFMEEELKNLAEAALKKLQDLN